jgi:ribose transport system permease protein
MISILRRTFSSFELAIPLVLVVVLFAVSAVRSPNLFTIEGMAGAVLVAAPLILAAMAMTPIAMAGRGGVDLAIGPLVGFINVTIVAWLSPHGWGQPLTVFVYAIAVACLWQALVALIIIKVCVSPIIVMLAGYMVLAGLNLVILPRPSGTAPDWLADWGYGTKLWSPVLAILVAAGLIWFVFQRSALFGHIRMLGADEKTAYTSGINTTVVRLCAHLLGAIFAALAAICLTGVIGSGDPNQGNRLTLQATTALVLGGTALSGGRGSALGSALGAIAMFLISNVLSTFSFGSMTGFITQACYGAILVLTLQMTLIDLRRFLSPKRLA